MVAAPPAVGLVSSQVRAHRFGFALAWAVAIAAYAAFGAWLVSHPPQLSSDDALFFAHGLVRYSILDLSPQFPGYPGFIAMGRVLLPFAGGDPLHALALLTGFIAIALPPMAALIAFRHAGPGWPPVAAFLLTLTMPLLPDLALSLLSDGVALVFLLLFLVLLPGKGQPYRLRALLAGVALGWALACRPSDVALLGGAGLGALIADRRLFWPGLAGGLIVVLPTAAVMLVIEPLYLTEGLRFTEGHALIWGNTPLSRGPHGDNWFEAIAAMPAGLWLVSADAVGVVVALRYARGLAAAPLAILVALLAHAAWIAGFQNPDSLRHLAPLLLLGGLLIVLIAPRLRGLGIPLTVLCGLFQIWSLVSGTELRPSEPPPLQSAITYLRGQGQGAAVATNQGVFLLRDALPATRVYDMHYPADAALGLATATGPTFRLTSTSQSENEPATTFPGRFIGEPTLYLYRTNSAD